MNDDTKPALPEPFDTDINLEDGVERSFGLFTADQMLAYGQAREDAAIERCADMLMTEHDGRKHLDNHAAYYARAIRALKKGQPT